MKAFVYKEECCLQKTEKKTERKREKKPMTLHVGDISQSIWWISITKGRNEHRERVNHLHQIIDDKRAKLSDDFM